MDAAPRREPIGLIARWVGVGVLFGLVIGLAAAVVVRSPSEAPTGLAVVVPASGDVEMTFLGGSLTNGSGATSEADTFVQRIVDGLGVPSVVNRGDTSGSSLSDVLETVHVPLGASLVVVELGSTDFYVEKTSPERFAEEYAQLLAAVRQRTPDAAVVCLGIWAATANATDYDRAISDACSQEHGHFVPLADLYDDAPLRGPEGRPTIVGPGDTFHPNDAGHAAIASRVLDSLRVVREEQ